MSTLLEGRRTRDRKPLNADKVAALAREFADWRIQGCPGYGFHEAIKAKVEKVARAANVSYGEVWAVVHQQAYAILDATPAMRLKSQG